MEKDQKPHGLGVVLYFCWRFRPPIAATGVLIMTLGPSCLPVLPVARGGGLTRPAVLEFTWKPAYMIQVEGLGKQGIPIPRDLTIPVGGFMCAAMATQGVPIRSPVYALKIP